MITKINQHYWILLLSCFITITSYGANNNEVESISKSAIEPCRSEYQKAIKKSPPVPSDGNILIAYMSESDTENYAKQTANLASCLVTKSRAYKNKQNLDFNTRYDVNLAVIDDNYDVVGEFDAAIPIWKNASKSKSLFFQPGFILLLHSNDRSSLDVNAGAVYRFTVSKGIIGLNIFYDYSRVFDDGNNSNNFSHKRGSVGIDYQTGRNYLSANYYFPITGWVNIDEYYKEQALGGFDIHFERLITKKISVFLGLSDWDYRGGGANHFKQTLGLEYKLSCKTSLRTDFEYDSEENDLTSWLRVQLELGKENKDPKKCLQEEFDNGSVDMYRIAEREKRVLYEGVRRKFSDVKLSLQDQTLQLGSALSYTIQDSNITGLRDGETSTITVTSTSPVVTYNASSKTFSTQALNTAGTFTVAGTISDGVNSSNWSFVLNVVDSTLNVGDNTAPTLSLQDQMVELGSALSYTIQDSNISELRADETSTITVTSTSPVVTYNASSKTFSTQALNTAGTFTVAGTISDGVNSSNWSFVLNVVDSTLNVGDNTAPTLSLQDQMVELGSALSYTIQDSNISELRADETSTITVTSTSPVVTYNASSKTFSTQALNTAGTFTVAGTISDGVNSSNWSFMLSTDDTTAPILIIQDQRIIGGNAFSYTIQDSNITEVRDGETIIITVTSPTMAPTMAPPTMAPTMAPPTMTGMLPPPMALAVTYNASTKTFSSQVIINPAEEFTTVRGTISDGVNSSNWSFKIRFGI